MSLELPRSYESFILNLKKYKANLATTLVKNRLLIEEKLISRNENSSKEYHEEQALYTRSFVLNRRNPQLEGP